MTTFSVYVLYKIRAEDRVPQAVRQCPEPSEPHHQALAPSQLHQPQRSRVAATPSRHEALSAGLCHHHQSLAGLEVTLI